MGNHLKSFHAGAITVDRARLLLMHVKNVTNGLTMSVGWQRFCEALPSTDSNH
jgi:hypothetical protein